VYKSILIAVFFSVCLMSVKAQTADFRQHDSLTLHYFEAKNWEAVLQAGNASLENGYDYYYLRIRMGIAAYQTQHFLLARKHFRRALDFYEKDPLASAYLYGTYVELNQLSLGGKASYNLSNLTLKNLNVKRGFRIASIHVDAGNQTYTHKNRLSYSGLTGNDALYGESREYNNLKIFDLGVTLQLNASNRLYLGIQSLDFEVTDRFAYSESTVSRDSVASFDWGKAYYYAVDTSQQTADFRNRIQQQSFYLQLDKAISNQVNLIGAFHLISLNQTRTQAENHTTTYTDTAYYLYDGSDNALFSTTQNSFSFTQIAFRSKEWSSYLGVNMSSRIGVTTVGVSLSRFNQAYHFQGNASLNYYPFGNLKLYGSTAFFVVNSNSNTRAVIGQKIGFQAFRNFWVEVNYTQGNHAYLVKDNAYLIFNTSYQTQSRLDAAIYAKIAKNLMLRLGYVYQSGRHPYSIYDAENNALTEKYHDYQTNTIIGGIKWNF